MEILVHVIKMFLLRELSQRKADDNMGSDAVERHERAVE